MAGRRRDAAGAPSTEGPDRPEAEAGSAPRATIAHVPALDGLRGAAVAGVLVYHLGHLRGGFLGVDLFFVLSGFLITSLLLAEHRANGRIDLRSFWARRTRRLLPALVVLLLGVAAYAAVVARPIDLPGIRADALATVGYVANWRTILGGGSYWDISLAPSPLQHTWSLAIEEQFYVLWPLLFVALVARARKGRAELADLVLQVAIVGAAASALGAGALHRLGSSDTRIYEGTDTRAAALLLGVALAAWRARAERRSSVVPTERWAGRGHLAEGVGIAAVLALGALWVGLDGRSPWLYRGGLALASVLAVVTVAAASRPSSKVVGRAFAVAPLRWLGAISYGLYLWHWPIYQGLDAANGRLPGLGARQLDGTGLVAAKLGLSLLVAVASYVVVEQPIRRGRIPTRLAPAAVGGSLAVAVLAVLLATTGGVQPTPIAPPPDGRLARIQGAPTVVVAGDSVGLSVASRFYADPERFAINPVNHTRIGCTVVADGVPARSFAGAAIDPPSCRQYALEGLAAAEPDVVLLLVGSRPNDAVRVGGRWVEACDPAYDEQLRAAEVALLEELRSTGAQVVVGTVLRSGAESLPVPGSEERIACVNRVIASLPEAVEGVHVIDLNELLCPPGGPCVEELEGHPVRSDGLHFDGGPGGDLVADWVAAELLAAIGPRATDDAARPEPSPPPPSTPDPDVADPSDARLASIPGRTLDWLRRVSERATGRPMDPSGSQYWGERLVAGTKRAVVTESLVGTESWRRQRVLEAFVRWQRAAPTDHELERWQAWLVDHTTSELDLHLATQPAGRDANGTSHLQRAEHLAEALGLPPAVDHFAGQLRKGVPWATVVRTGYFSHPGAERRMLDLAPRSAYTPELDALVAEFRWTGDERMPEVRALATLA